MQPGAPLIDNPFAVLSFLAAPAILTNASTVLALSTSNRLARATDRARAAYASVMSGGAASPTLARKEFEVATRRAHMLVRALGRQYLAAGCFAAGTCFALLGAFAGHFHVRFVPAAAQVLTPSPRSAACCPWSGAP